MNLRSIIGFLVTIVLFVCFLSFLEKEEKLTVVNNNINKTTDVLQSEVPYSTQVIYDNSLSASITKVVQEGKNGIVIKQNSLEKVLVETVDEIIRVGTMINSTYKEKEEDLIVDTFMGSMTAYGPDCVGCSGIVACKPYQDVRNGNIYYNDAKYGQVRIVASDGSIPCGSIIKITNVFGEPFLAITLDRGGAIKGTKMDLLYNSEDETRPFGVKQNIQYDFFRWGW